MISPDLKALIARFSRTTWIIWFAFVFAPVIYAVIGWSVVQGRTEGFESTLPAEAVFVLILLAFISGPVLAFMVMPRVYGPVKILAQGNVEPLGNFGEDQPRYERLGEHEKKKAQMFGAIQTSYIIRWACAESVAIYGLLGLFTGVLSLNWAWAFSAAAIIMLVQLKPDYESQLEQL